MTDIHKLSGAYAVDAVDDLERARFEQHLTTCEDCRAEVAELRETVALLAATEATTPPPSLRDSVLAGISQVRPEPPVVPDPREETDSSQRPDPPTDEPPAPGARRLPPTRRWIPLLVAATLIVVAGLGVTVLKPWADDGPRDLSAAVLGADDAETVSLDLGAAGRATVVRSQEHNRAVLVTEDMVSAPEGKVYELWLQDPDGTMVPAGLMPDAPDQEVLIEGPANDATAVGITVEPAGGSQEPTSEPIAVFDFSEAT